MSIVDEKYIQWIVISIEFIVLLFSMYILYRELINNQSKSCNIDCIHSVGGYCTNENICHRSK